MAKPDNSDAPRTLTESQVAAVLALDRLEIYLLATRLGLGQYDSMTHLLTFTAADVERIAAHLGLAQPKLTQKPAEGKGRALKDVPEPRGE